MHELRDFCLIGFPGCADRNLTGDGLGVLVEVGFFFENNLLIGEDFVKMVILEGVGIGKQPLEVEP